MLRNFYPDIRLVEKIPIVQFSEKESVFLRDEVELKGKFQLMRDRQRQEKSVNGGVWSSTIDIISDFDQTISAFKDDNNTDVSATFGIFRKSKIVPACLNEEANKLFEKYHPYEVSKDLPFLEKKAKMDDWLHESMGLILQSGIDCQWLQRIINDNIFAFRHNFDNFLQLCVSKQLNLVVLSGGISDVIFYLMDQLYPMREYANFRLFANKILFEETGKVIGSDELVVHSHNKDALLSRESVEGLKSSCILLGDMPHDIFMTKHGKYDNEIKIGFARTLADVESFQRKYDIVLYGQGSFVSVEYLLRKIIDEPIPETLEIQVSTIAKNLQEALL